MALWLLLALTAGLCLTGLLVLVRGLRPPRRGDDPHCRHCDYNLTGVASPICPECGAPLAGEAIVRGERRRRPPLIFAGAFLALAGLFCSAWLVSTVMAARPRGTPVTATAQVRNAKLMIAALVAACESGQIQESRQNVPDGTLRLRLVGILHLVIKGYLPRAIATRVADPKLRAAALAELAAADALLLETQIMAAFSTAVASKKPEDIQALVALLKQLDQHMDNLLQILKGY